MKKTQSGFKLIALVSTFVLLCVAACTNNNQTTSSAADSSGTAINNDTAVSTMSTADSVTVAAGPAGTSAKKATTTRKGRASVGVLSPATASGMKPDKNGIYETTEVKPSFPGGQAALEDYITNNIEYPQMAVDDNKEGTVHVQFVVDEDGNVMNAKLVGADLGDGLGDEAVRVISKMPKWEPGKVKGKTVKTRLTLPVTYKIEE